jgi:hypothetical protein
MFKVVIACVKVVGTRVCDTYNTTWKAQTRRRQPTGPSKSPKVERSQDRTSLLKSVDLFSTHKGPQSPGPPLLLPWGGGSTSDRTSPSEASLSERTPLAMPWRALREVCNQGLFKCLSEASLSESDRTSKRTVSALARWRGAQRNGRSQHERIDLKMVQSTSSGLRRTKRV